jgi:putative tryptophan/tyrosine transport system substrate-binding protein
MRRREFIAIFGGAGIAWPLTARAQQPDRMRRIGVLMSTAESDPEEEASVAAFVRTLEKAGWVPGRNVSIDYRWGAGDPSRFQDYAKELVRLGPDVIFAKGASVPAVAEATSTIPIVFAQFTDVLAQDYVASFARPGGNITGFTSNEITLVGKRLEILKEIFPHMARVLYIRGSRPQTLPLFQRATESAPLLGLGLSDGAANNDAEIENAVALFVHQQNGGIIAGFDAFNIVHSGKIIELAARYRVPAIYFSRIFVESGGLVSYGFDQVDQFDKAAEYVDRILRGEKAGDLPVQAPTKFQLLVNLKTARSSGLTIPESFLVRADEVIE